MDTNPLEVVLHCGGFCANFPSDVNGEEDHIKGNTSAESDSFHGKGCQVWETCVPEAKSWATCRCYTKSSAVQDVFQPIPGLISFTGLTRVMGDCYLMYIMLSGG